MTEVTARIDVRTLTVWQRHPRIFAAFDRLPIGGRLEVVSDHEPRPLRYEFDVERPDEFVWDQRMLQEGEWRVAIDRLPKQERAPDRAAFLRRNSVLALLDAETRERLIAATFERSVVSGEAIVEQGSDFPYLGFVQSGVVAAVSISAGGRDQLVYEALPFETFAEAEVLDGGVAATRLAAAHGDARVILAPRDDVLAACYRSAMFSLRLGTAVARRMRMLIERSSVRAFGSTTARIARALLSYAAAAEGLSPAIPPLPQMTQSEIATLAGTVRVVASRTLADFVAAGAIALEQGRVTKIDRAHLERLSAL